MTDKTGTKEAMLVRFAELFAEMDELVEKLDLHDLQLRHREILCALTLLKQELGPDATVTSKMIWDHRFCSWMPQPSFYRGLQFVLENTDLIKKVETDGRANSFDLDV